MGVLVRVQDELQSLFDASLSLLVGKLPLLEECLEVDSHYYVYKVNLVLVVNWLVLFDVSDNLVKFINIRVDYLLPWFYLRLLRPRLMPENLLEQELSLFERLLLLTGNSLLLLSFLQLHLSLLFFDFDCMAGLAPLLANLGPELNGPAVVASTGYHNVRLALRLLDGAFAFLLHAGLLNAVNNLDTVVADSMLLSQLPEVVSTSGARSLHCLLASQLNVTLASDGGLGFIRICCSHQIFDGIEFWLAVSWCFSFSKTMCICESMLAWCIKKVLEDVCLENEFLWCPCWSLRELEVHF